ncbi:MAG: serine hydrolase domain-containing protein [Gammaproteobacteria bacterium]
MKRHLSFTRLLTLSMSIAFLSACSSGSNNTPPIDTSVSLRTQLKTVVDNAVDSGLPGVSLHLQDGDEHISIVAGVVNQGTAEPMTSSSLSHAGSIGKAFTATLVLRLVDMGFLRLDDPIDLWLDPAMSALIAESDKITIKMLLAHTNGIQNYFEIPEFQIAFLEAPGRIWAPMELLGYLENTENHFAPGTEYLYTDTSFLLAGIIAERVTGVSIGMALRQWVFEPAGLDNTFGPYETLGQPETMRAYLPISFFEDRNLDVDLDLPTDGSDVDATAWLNSEGDGHASVQSIPADLNTFIRILIDTDTLVSEELKAQMMTESFPGSSQYGLGLQIIDDGDRFGHDGKGLGLHSSMTYSPSEDLSLATVVNASFGNYDELYGEFVNQLYQVLERRQ